LIKISTYLHNKKRKKIRVPSSTSEAVPEYSSNNTSHLTHTAQKGIRYKYHNIIGIPLGCLI